MRKYVIVALLAGLVGALVATPVAVYASHQFNDVPSSHTFHNSIQWMADNGITVGCNEAGTEYCPEDGVTRGQMSAFMKRLAENQVVDAATLEGKPAAVLGPRASFNSASSAPPGASFTLPVEITAPARGILILSGTVDATNTLVSDAYTCSLLIDGEAVPGTEMQSLLGSNNTREDCSTTGAAVVSAGTHAVTLEVAGLEPTTDLSDSSVWALWVPFDGTGAIPSD
jgi:hypothetical protein